MGLIRSSIVAIVLLATSGCVVATASASAAVTPRTSFVTAYSTPGDFVGGGLSYVWSSAASDEIRVVPTRPATASIDIETLDSSQHHHFDFLFQPPTGKQLTRGSFVFTQRGVTRTSPGLDVSADDRGCNTQAGRFQILDIGPNKSRFRALYQFSCEGGPALFGEISYNEPASPQDVILASDRIIWPALLPGRSARVVPVLVANTSSWATRFTKATITTGSPFFRVTHNGCRLVPAHSACTVWVRFYPETTGEHEGKLTIHGTRGDYAVDLAGYGLQGHTNWTMTSDRADAVGLGRRYSFSQRTSTMLAVSNNGQLQVGALADDAIEFTAEFSGTPGHPLIAGQHFRRTLTTTGPDQPNPVLFVQGESRACATGTQGEFDVVSAAYTNAAVTRLAINFVQHCGTSAAALTGKIDYEVLPAPATAPAWAGLSR